MEIEDIESGQKYNFILVSPNKADYKITKLSVLAPIGVALLGYRPDIKVDWEMPTGFRTFRIVLVKRITEIKQGSRNQDNEVLILNQQDFLLVTHNS